MYPKMHVSKDAFLQLPPPFYCSSANGILQGYARDISKGPISFYLTLEKS